MERYISKSALVAEIKRRMNENRGKQTLPQYFGMVEEDLNILSFIDTLEVKEVQENLQARDLGNAAEECANKRLEWADPEFAHSNYSRHNKMGVQYFTGADLEDVFIDGAQWQKKNILKDAQGDDLPEIDKTIIAVQGIIDPTATDSFCGYKVVFAHRTCGGGWNITNVLWWLDLNLELPRQLEPKL